MSRSITRIALISTDKERSDRIMNHLKKNKKEEELVVASSRDDLLVKWKEQEDTYSKNVTVGKSVIFIDMDSITVKEAALIGGYGMAADEQFREGTRTDRVHVLTFGRSNKKCPSFVHLEDDESLADRIDRLASGLEKVSGLTKTV